jgi:hypothetical protein
MKNRKIPRASSSKIRPNDRLGSLPNSQPRVNRPGRFVEEQQQDLGCRNADFFIEYLRRQLDLLIGAPHRSLWLSTWC